MSKLKPPIKAIIFDLDDTLLAEVDYVRSGFRAVASRLARPGYDADKIFDMLWLRFEQGPRDKVFNYVLSEMNQAANSQVIAELISIYRCHRPVLKLDKNLHKMLKKLQKSYKTGIITDGFLPAQKLKIQALQIEQYFDKVIYTEQLGREFWKPAPQAFLIMAKSLRVPHDSCVYVADNPRKDFTAPRQLGWQTVQVNLSQKVHTINSANTANMANTANTVNTDNIANMINTANVAKTVNAIKTIETGNKIETSNTDQVNNTSNKNADNSIEKADLYINTPLELVNILP